MENRELYIKALNAAQKISDYGPAIIDELQITEKKRLYSLILEAFRSFSAFSMLIQKHFLVQSSAVLRILVEETAKVIILVEHPELYEDFAKHCQVREEVLDLSQKERKLKVLEIFKTNNIKNGEALSFLDYGWVKPISNDGEFGYHVMLKIAHVEGSTILKWVDELDQLIHQNIDSTSLTDDGFKQLELDFIYLSCITFEHLFNNFCNLLGKRSKVYEEDFLPLYNQMLKPEDKVK